MNICLMTAQNCSDAEQTDLLLVLTIIAITDPMIDIWVPGN